MADARSLLEGQWLQLFWPDDGTWWPAQVLEMDVRACTCTLLYETGTCSPPALPLLPGA